MGKEGKYDLKLAETPQLSDSDTESDCEPGEEEMVETAGCQQTAAVCHPAKLIKAASYQLMRSLTLGCALHADNMQLSAVHKVTSILRQVVQLGCQSVNVSTPEHLLLAKDQRVDWWNYRSYSGKTPLYVAIYHGHVHIVQILLSIKDQDFCVKNDEEDTLAMLAVKNENKVSQSESGGEESELLSGIS